MMEQEITTLIGTVGFPIAISIFLLIERSKSMKELSRAINDLSILIKSKVK